MDRARLRVALGYGILTHEGNEERRIGDGASRIRLGRVIGNVVRKCRDHAAPGRKDDCCEPLGGGAEAWNK